jgi:hypothetical protein
MREHDADGAHVTAEATQEDEVWVGLGHAHSFGDHASSYFRSSVTTWPSMHDVAAQEMAVGTHWVRVIGDSVFVTVVGMLTVDDMRALYNLAARVKEQHERVFFCYDGRQSTGIDPNARKIGAEGNPEKSTSDLRVIYGISFTMRVIVNMLVRTQKALLNRDIRVHIFKHEKDALEFFEKECARLRKELRRS